MKQPYAVRAIMTPIFQSQESLWLAPLPGAGGN